MADGLQVGGLASGLDTTSIINGLIQIEMRRVTREDEKKKDYELKLSTFNELKGKLDDFYAKSKEMDKSTNLNVFKGTSSDATVATISGEDGATAGNFDIKVVGLASSLKVASKSFTQAASMASLGLSGSFKVSTSNAAQLADPTVTDVEISLDGTETLKDVAAKINRSKGSAATATVVKFGEDDYRLMLTGVDEGTKSFTLNNVSGNNIFGNALGLVDGDAGFANETESVRTKFDLKLNSALGGGPATAASTFAQLFNGVGGTGITAGDKITISGTTAAGATPASIDFTIDDPSWTLDKLLTVGDAGGNSIQSYFGGAANVDVTMNSSGEIVVKDKTSGVTHMTLTLAFADTDTSGSKLSLGATGETRTSFTNIVSEGKKAFYQLSDLSMSSQTNKDKTTVAGTVFELKRADTTQTVKLQLDYDKDGIKKKVQDFLDSYNLLVKFIDDKSKVEVKQNKDENNPAAVPTGKAQVVKGPFSGDSSILGLKEQLRSMMTGKISELTDQNLSKFSSLASMGITSEKKTGFLTINDETFKAALDTDFEGVKRVFMTGGYSTNGNHVFGTYSKDTKTGVYQIDPGLVLGAGQFDTDKGTGTSMVAATLTGNNDVMNSDSGDSKGMAVKASVGSGIGTMTFVRGVGGQIKDFYEKVTNFVDGFVTETAKSMQRRIDDETKQIERLEKQVGRVKERLTKQFANLEISISKLQSQSSSFQGQISGIRR